METDVSDEKVSGFVMDRYEAGHYFRKYSKLSEKLTGALPHDNALSVGLLIGNGPGTEWPAMCLENHIFELHRSAAVVHDTFKVCIEHFFKMVSFPSISYGHTEHRTTRVA